MRTKLCKQLAGLCSTIAFAFTAPAAVAQQEGAKGALFDTTPGLPFAQSKAALQSKTLTATQDNRNLLGPIKNQGGCGSCVVFAAHAVLEGSVARDFLQGRAGPNTAEQQTLDCAADAFPSLCKDGSSWLSVLDVMAADGVTNETVQYLPNSANVLQSGSNYSPQRASCIARVATFTNNTTFPFRPLRYRKIGASSVAEIKQLIDTYKVVGVSSYWNTPVRGGPTGDVFTFAKSAQNIGHAYVLLGWDDSKQAFLARNSWGGGDNSISGYFWLAYSEASPSSVSQLVFREGGVYVIEARVDIPPAFNASNVDATKRRLSLIVRGSGKGSVSFNGQSYSDNTTLELPQNSNIALTAAVDSATASTFVGWKGICSGTNTSCQFRLTNSETVVVDFGISANDVEPILAGALGAQLASVLKSTPAVSSFSRDRTVFAGQATLIDRMFVTEDVPEIVVDPSFFITNGIYVPFQNTRKHVLRIKRLVVDFDWLQKPAKVNIKFKVPSYVSTGLVGALGANGARGGDGASDGAAGNPGQPGGNGGAGTSRQLSQMIIIVDSVEDAVGRKVPDSKYSFRYEFPGPSSGNGGNGGRGGDGGTGAGGQSGSCNFFGCTRGPGDGGPGGAAGNGGNGGNGGDAGYGGRVVVFAPVAQSQPVATATYDLTPGRTGLGGLAGPPGNPGAGGARGSRPCNCTGGSDGPPGQTAVQNSKRGDDGRIGGEGVFDVQPLVTSAATARGAFGLEYSLGGAVQFAKLSNIAARSLSLDWERAPILSSQPIIVERLDGNGAWAQVATVASTATSAELSGLTPGTTYTHRLRANGDDISLAPVITAKTLAAAASSCASDPNADCDNDSVPNAVEAQEGLNPNVKDNDVFANSVRGRRLFVMQMYRDVLKREGEAAGVTYWQGRLESGLVDTITRSEMVQVFLFSPESTSGRVLTPEEAVTKLYQVMLVRNPEAEGLAFWAAEYRRTGSLLQLCRAFVDSAEYRARFL